MIIRLIIVLTILAACSDSGDATRVFEISAARLAEIKSKPYTPGNGPGGFATASLSGIADAAWPEGILFTGYGPYLHEMGFGRDMMITAIDDVSVNDIFVSRWQALRLHKPSGFDAAHYKDLIEYIFRKQPGDHVMISVDLNASTAAMIDGTYEPEIELWRINFQP